MEFSESPGNGKPKSNRFKIRASILFLISTILFTYTVICNVFYYRSKKELTRQYALIHSFYIQSSPTIEGFALRYASSRIVQVKAQSDHGHLVSPFNSDDFKFIKTKYVLLDNIAFEILGKLQFREVPENLSDIVELNQFLISSKKLQMQYSKSVDDYNSTCKTMHQLLPSFLILELETNPGDFRN